MKKLLLYILISSNFLLLSSAHDREYTQNTCHRTFRGGRLFTYEEREECLECTFSRVEMYDKVSKKYIASIAYDPFECSIKFLSVDEKFQKQGNGSDLVNRAIEDMRVNYNCREISLSSDSSAKKFWEKRGAPSKSGSLHVFSDPSSNVS